MPLDPLSSTALARLSPHATKLLFCVLVAQLKPNGYGNGRLDMKVDRLRACGWASRSTAYGALAELVEAELVVCTRRGAKGRLAMYGVTLWPMYCDHADLDVGPGAWTARSWREPDGADLVPSSERPVTWGRARSSSNRHR